MTQFCAVRSPSFRSTPPAVKDLAVDGPVVELLPDGEARYSLLGNDGSTFYFLTTKNAARSRVVALDLHERVVREIVSESDDRLDAATMFGDLIVASYLRDARAEVVVYSLSGAMESTIALPGLGTVVGFGGERSDRETFYAYTSYTEPTTIYRYDVAGGQSSGSSRRRSVWTRARWGARKCSIVRRTARACR